MGGIRGSYRSEEGPIGEVGPSVMGGIWGSYRAGGCYGGGGGSYRAAWGPIVLGGPGAPPGQRRIPPPPQTFFCRAQWKTKMKVPCRALQAVNSEAVSTDSRVTKRRPKAHVSPSSSSSAMAPRAQDLGVGGGTGGQEDPPLPYRSPGSPP